MTINKLARDLRNNWGLNGITFDANGASAMALQKCRWVRNDLVNLVGGSPGSEAAALATAMVSAGVFDPNPKVQAIIDYYLNPFISWPAQQTYLNTALTLTTQNGKKLFRCIEGPNEIGELSDGGNGGGGCTVAQSNTGSPGTANNGAGDNATGAEYTVSRACFGGWAQAASAYRSSNTSIWTGVELIGPTILDSGQSGGSTPLGSPSGYPGDFESPAYPSGAGLAISGYVDYGTMHWYNSVAYGGNGAPSSPLLPGLSAKNYGQAYSVCHTGFRNGFTAGTKAFDLVVSETGQSNGGWAADGLSQGWSVMALFLDHFAMGGHRIIFYTATGNNGFNWFINYPTSLYPHAQMMANISDLLSLGNNYNAVGNAETSDTNTITPSYTGTNLTITVNSGTPYWGTAGNIMVLAKSDGTYMIPVWRQPQYDDGTGASASQIPAACNITVNFGQSVSYNLWDPTGGSGGGTHVVSSSATKVGFGTGTSATFNLYASPIFIEITSATATESPNNTFVTTVGPQIVDSSLNTYSISGSGTIIANNAADMSGVSVVIELYYHSHILYYQSSTKLWYSRTSISSPWIATSAPFNESAAGTDITTVGPTITDSFGNVYSVSSGQQVLVNGVADPNTSSVVEIYYGSNRQLYQLNSAGNWYTQTSPNATYVQTTSPKTGTAAPGASLLSTTVVVTPIKATFTWSQGTGTITDTKLILTPSGGVGTTYDLSSVATTNYVDNLTPATNYTAYEVNVNTIGSTNSNSVTFKTANAITNSPTGTVITPTSGTINYGNRVYTVNSAGQVVIDGNIDSSTSGILTLALISTGLVKQISQGVWYTEPATGGTGTATSTPNLTGVAGPGSLRFLGSTGQFALSPNGQFILQ